jgi:Uma2 family endonuclease
MRAIKDQKHTLEEYFELEKNSEEKWEFWGGQVWNMSGASLTHEQIVANIIVTFRHRLPKGCGALGSNVKVKVPAFAPYRYPDLTVVCGKMESEVVSGLEVLLNPLIIVEVLSPSTERFDRGAKFTYYKSIPSLREYLLVATEQPIVTQFVKGLRDEWINRDFEGIDAELALSIPNVRIPLAEIYLDVVFPEREIPDPEIERVPEKDR